MASVHPDPAYMPPDQAIYANPAYPPQLAQPTQAQNGFMGGVSFGDFNQPTQKQSMPASFTTSGLDLLSDRDMVKITKLFNQEVAFTYIDQARKFKVENNETQQLFSIIEDDLKMSTHVNYRTFEINALDPSGKNVFKITRNNGGCCTYCCFCCGCLGDGCKTGVEVEIDGRTYGYIKQNCSFSHADFTIYKKGSGDNDEVLLNIVGGSALCTPTVLFQIQHPTESSIQGSIRKRGLSIGGLSNEFDLHFPPSSDKETKAMCIAAVILFDYRFYNRPPPRRRSRR